MGLLSTALGINRVPIAPLLPFEGLTMALPSASMDGHAAVMTRRYHRHELPMASTAVPSITINCARINVRARDRPIGGLGAAIEGQLHDIFMVCHGIGCHENP